MIHWLRENEAEVGLGACNRIRRPEGGSRGIYKVPQTTP